MNRLAGSRNAPTNATANAPANAPPNAPANAMTVDVEDYFQVYAFFHCIPRESWDRYDRRVEANVDRILAQFAVAGVSATFFTLGWIAERHQAMVRRIVDAGHELASHGYDHQRVDRMDPAAFREDLRRTRGILEDAGHTAVRGYRAPTFSIGATCDDAGVPPFTATYSANGTTGTIDLQIPVQGGTADMVLGATLSP